MLFNDFKDKLFSDAKERGFADCELFYTANKNFSVRIFKGEIAEYKNSNTLGVGFRGTYDNQMGYSYSEHLDESVINKLLDEAIANASVVEEPDVEKLYEGDKEYPEVNTFNPALDDVTAEEKINKAIELDKYVTNADPRIKMADYCTVATSESESAIANSYGLNLSSKNNMAIAYIMARAEENDIVKSGMEFWKGRDFSEFDYKKVGDKAVKDAIDQLGAKSMPSGQYPVVLNNDTANQVFTTFLQIFYAENAQKGFSLLSKDRIGEKLAADIVTLRDDAICEYSIEASSFDAEGVAAQNKAIIENGELKTLLYNTKSAAKDGVKSTGNASKPGFGGMIGTSAHNFYLVPGKKSFDELIANITEGVLITDLAGLHSGTNPVSGDFSVSASGFLIKDGKVDRPVEQITLAGNFYEVLKNIEDIASDLRFFMGRSGMPSVLVKGLNIAGNE